MAEQDLISITIPSQQPQRFQSVDELSSWLSKESKCWRRLRPNLAVESKASEWCLNIYTDLERYEEQLKSGRLDDQLHAEIVSFYKKTALTSASHEFQFVREIAKSYGPKTVSGALEFILSRHRAIFSDEIDSIDAGRALGFLASERVPKGTDYAPHQNLLEKYVNELEAARNGLTEFKDEWEKKIKALSQHYENVRNLEEPISYWRKKQRNHALLASIVFVGALYAACTGGRLILQKDEAVKLAIKSEISSLASQSVAGVWATVFPHFLPLILGAFGLIWLIRVLMRVFFSQLHSASDAAERVTLISTYLAMMTKLGNVSEQERLIVFTQIFRHANTGVFEDAVPEMPFKHLTDLSSKAGN